MEKVKTSVRLKEIMNKTGMKQIDILEKCKPYCEQYNEKINKSHLSQWVNGVNEPNQRKIKILSEVLCVEPAWLMGYDVPMTKDNDYVLETGITLAKLYKNVLLEESIRKLAKLNQDDQEVVCNLINSLFEKVEK